MVSSISNKDSADNVNIDTALWSTGNGGPSLFKQKCLNDNKTLLADGTGRQQLHHRPRQC